jgi:exosortase/archaeosortase family protein
MPLAVLAFPWISLDCEFLGFWFRLSGAHVAESFLQWQGVAVERMGTLMNVGNVELDVSEACGGLNSLQTMLIGGFALAYIQLSHSRWFWLSAPILVAAAWAANTGRVLLTAYIVVWGEPHWASGQNHEWQGLAVLFVSFLMCAGIFTCLRGGNDAKQTELNDAQLDGGRG